MGVEWALVIACLLALVGCNVEKKAPSSLEERVASLQEQMYKRTMIRMNLQKFRLYARSTPRNYSIILLLTAQHNQQCRVCGSVYEEFDIVANSYRVSHMTTKRVYFAVADFEDASEVFHTLGINAIPVVMHIPMHGTPKSKDKMDFSRVGYSAEAIGKWVQDKTDVHIRILRPANYAGPSAVLLLFVLVGGLLYMKRNSLDFLYSRNMWSVVVAAFVIAFLSGQMWNQIRGPPFMHRNPQTGQLLMIASSSQMQFVAETYLVFALYALMTVGFLLLIYAGDSSADCSGNNAKKRVMVITGFAIVLVVFSYMVSVFRMKTHGYPYRLLFQ